MLVLDGECTVRHAQLVTELTDEPDYDAAMAMVRRINAENQA